MSRFKKSVINADVAYKISNSNTELKNIEILFVHGVKTKNSSSKEVFTQRYTWHNVGSCLHFASTLVESSHA